MGEEKEKLPLIVMHATPQTTYLSKYFVDYVIFSIFLLLC